MGTCKRENQADGYEWHIRILQSGPLVCKRYWLKKKLEIKEYISNRDSYKKNM